MPPAGDNVTFARPTAPHKVLFVAFACEPYRGSEPGVGWNFVHEMAGSQPVWVITHASHREPVEAYLNQFPTPHPIHATYISMPGLEWLKARGYFGFNIYYYLWQFVAARAMRRLHVKVRFDVVQHVSLMRWWMSTAAVTLATRGAKLVWGPVGAGELMDHRFTSGIGLRNRALEFARNAARWIGLRDPGLRRTVRNTSVALASTRESAERLRELGVKNIEFMSGMATNLPREVFAARAAHRSEPHKFRFISGGGLIYWKRFDLVVRAFKQANLTDAEYVHVCGGHEQERLEQLTRDLGMADRVKFLGEMPYTQCVAELARSDAMVHPVLRDSSGLVLEALTLGLPVLTIDHLSPGYFVTPECGHKVPLARGASPDELVDAFARVMRAWYDDRELLARLSAGAARRGEELSRPNRNRALLALYDRIIAAPEPVQLSIGVSGSTAARVA